MCLGKCFAAILDLKGNLKRPRQGSSLICVTVIGIGNFVGVQSYQPSTSKQQLTSKLYVTLRTRPISSGKYYHYPDHIKQGHMGTMAKGLDHALRINTIKLLWRGVKYFGNFVSLCFSSFPLLFSSVCFSLFLITVVSGPACSTPQLIP